MKLLGYICFMACAFLASCSTTDLYYHPLKERPAKPWKNTSSRWGGYVETFNKGTTNIRFEAYNKPTAQEASYFATLRAAERTLIDGKTHFYITKPINLNSDTEQSYFPAYVIPGYWERERIKYCDTCPRTGNDVNCRYEYDQVWCPPEYVPEEYVTNYIHTAQLSIAYSGRKNQRRSAVKIAQDALSNSAGLGRPKLDPRAMATLAAQNNVPPPPRSNN